MFCKWCGKKLTGIGTSCPSCGQNQGPMESGNSFWDLCEKKPAAPAPQPVATKPQSPRSGKVPTQTPAVRKPSPGSKTFNIWFAAWAATFVLLIVSVAFNAFSGSDNENKNPNVSLGGNSQTETKPNTTDPDNKDHSNQDSILDHLQNGINVTIPEDFILPADEQELTITYREVISQPGHWSLDVQGELLLTKGAQFYWQERTGSDTTWKTIGNDSYPRIIDDIHASTYRIVCVTNDETGIRAVYGVILQELPEITDQDQSDPAASEPEQTKPAGSGPKGGIDD